MIQKMKIIGLILIEFAMAHECQRGSMECMGSTLRTCTDEGYWNEMQCPGGTSCKSVDGSVSCKRKSNKDKNVDVMIDTAMATKSKSTNDVDNSQEKEVDSEQSSEKNLTKGTKSRNKKKHGKDKTVTVTRPLSMKRSEENSNENDGVVTVTKVPKEIELDVDPNSGQNGTSGKFFIKLPQRNGVNQGKSTVEYKVEPQVSGSVQKPSSNIGANASAQSSSSQVASSETSPSVPSVSSPVPSSPTPAATPTPTPAPAATPTPTPAANPSPSPAATPTPTANPTPVASSPAPTANPSPSPAPTASPSSPTPNPQTSSPAPSPSPSSPTPSPSPSSPTPAPSSSPAATPTPTPGKPAEKPAASANSNSSQGSSSSDKSSSSSSGGSTGGEVITLDQLQKAMKEVNFQPKQEYITVAVKKTNAKYKDKEMVAMFLAQLAHESGGFAHIEEIKCKEKGCPNEYNTGALPGKSYHGRGFIQLTWPDNYKAASKALGMGEKLFQEPEQVIKNVDLAMDVSTWYWDTRVLTAAGVKDKKQFGLTTKAINGALECGKGSNPQAEKRYTIYKAIAKAMGITNLAANTGC